MYDPPPALSSLKGFVFAFALWLVGAATAVPAAGPPPTATREAPPKLVLVSWDGAGDELIDRLLAAGELPHLAALARRGAAAEWSQSTWPTKTAAAHATLWTGAWPRTHGVADNNIPPDERGRASVLESVSGFSSSALRAEPLFVTAARAGKKVVVLGGTQGDPGVPLAERLRRGGVPRGRLLTFNGFDHRIAEGRLYGPEMGRSFELKIGETPFRVELIDDPENPLGGLDAVRILSGDRQAVLAPRPAAPVPAAAVSAIPRPGTPQPGELRAEAWSPAFPVRDGDLSGHTFFRLFALSPDGAELALYQHSVHDFGGLHRLRQRRGLQAAVPGFHDVPFTRYLDGAFGPPLMAGGDGTAERRVLEITALDAERQAHSVGFVLEHWRPDVVVGYSPQGDAAGHAWVGVLDPRSPAHDPALADRLWPFYVEVFRQLDRWLGEIVRQVSPDTLVAVVSDHGMHGTLHHVRVNRILEQAGLLVRDESGAIDLGQTRVVLTGSAFGLRLNGHEWQRGLVAPEEREPVLEAASRALLAARDPRRGETLFRAVHRPAELAAFGVGGPRSADLYVDPARGYYPSSSLGDEILFAKRPWGSGEHGFDPTWEEMRAIFYVAGPGVRPGVTAPPVRHVDVAPTFAHLLGIPAPAKSEGERIEAILERPAQLSAQEPWKASGDAPDGDAPGELRGLRLLRGAEPRYLPWRYSAELARQAVELECAPAGELLEHCTVAPDWQPVLGKKALPAAVELDFFAGELYQYSLFFEPSAAAQMMAAVEAWLGAPKSATTLGAENLIGPEVELRRWIWQTESTLVVLVSQVPKDLSRGLLRVTFTPVASSIVQTSLER